MNNEIALVEKLNPVPPDSVVGAASSADARALRRAIVESNRSARRRRRPRRALVLAVAVLVVCGGTAVGAKIALTGSDVHEFLPRGSAVFTGTTPTCTTVRPGLEYDCTLASVPTGEQQFDADGSLDFKGWVDNIVDGDNHVAGGCRALTKDGLRWRCYLGEEAVKQGVVDQGVLGQTQLAPGHG